MFKLIPVEDLSLISVVGQALSVSVGVGCVMKQVVTGELFRDGIQRSRGQASTTRQGVETSLAVSFVLTQKLRGAPVDWRLVLFRGRRRPARRAAARQSR